MDDRKVGTDGAVAQVAHSTPAPGQSYSLSVVSNAADQGWASKMDLIRRTIAKDASDDELELFFYQAHRSGLDPLSRQIHLVGRWDNRAGRMVHTIQVSIDGYRLLADRTGKYAGSDDYRFDDNLTEYEHIATGRGNPMTATVTVWKIVSGHRVSFSATARWEEYYPGDRQGFMWKKMPYLMLGKCAESLALRKAFPAELSGMYTPEEMEQAGFIQVQQEPVHTPAHSEIEEILTDEAWTDDEREKAREMAKGMRSQRSLENFTKKLRERLQEKKADEVAYTGENWTDDNPLYGE